METNDNDATSASNNTNNTTTLYSLAGSFLRPTLRALTQACLSPCLRSSTSSVDARRHEIIAEAKKDARRKRRVQEKRRETLVLAKEDGD